MSLGYLPHTSFHNLQMETIIVNWKLHEINAIYVLHKIIDHLYQNNKLTIRRVPFVA